jgi:hypothetical protein
MRTTIELSPEHRARLLELAARKGEKGFSRLIADALDLYLQAQSTHDEQRKRALLLKGALPAREAIELRAAAAELRQSWR